MVIRKLKEAFNLVWLIVYCTGIIPYVLSGIFYQWLGETLYPIPYGTEEKRKKWKP